MNTSKEPVKVLAIVSQLNRGGLESRLMDILRQIDFEKVQIDIFTYHLDEGMMDEEAKQLGCKIYYNPILTPKNMFWYVEYFKKFLLKHPEYKIVHAHQDAWCTVFCKGAYKANVPVRIAHSRTAISSFSIRNMVKNIIKLPTRKYATHLFAVSDKAGEWLYGQKALESGKVEIWKNAIDCSKYIFDSELADKVKKELDIQEQKVIMHVGNFTEPKNHKYIVDVFDKVHGEDKNTKLVLVGSDTPVEQNMDNIKNYVAEKGLQEDVLFLGQRKDVNRVLQAADVFLFPSIFEGLPGAVLEAQAAGVPCVISDSITTEVCVLNTTKMLSLKADIKEWQSAVVEGFSIPKTDTMKEMIESGFDIKELVHKLTKFYENAEVK